MASSEPSPPPPEASSEPAVEGPAETPPATTVEATAFQRYGRRLVFLAVAAVAVVALFWPRGSRAPAPGGFLVDAGGRPAPLAEHMAPVTLLHFFASWCPPCLTEGPSLDRLRSDLAGDSRFAVVMVAVRDDVARAQQLAGSEEVLFDPRWETAHRYGTRQLPESYLLVGGKVTRKFDGPVNWDDAQVRAAVQRAIAQAR